MSQNADESDLKEDYPSQLRDSLRCQILLKLVLRLPRLTVIPRTVFEHMTLLEVLDLSSSSIQSLPSSVSSLSSLKELLLRDCSFLIELPIEIGMLTKLKLLDIEGSEIMYIPKEIVELTDLEVLRLCLSQYAEYYIKAKNVNGGVKVPRMMISELKKLKELCISVCQEAEWWEKEIKQIQDEICHLENLEFLKWYLPTDTTLKQFLDIQINRKPAYEKLSNFTFTIGQHAQLTSCLPRGLENKFTEFEKCLKWINAEGNIYDISKIMTRAKALFLSRHWTIVNLSAFDISKLKYLLLAECNEMETLVKIDDLPEVVENNKKGGLESLEYLSVHYMEKLKSMWEGPIGKDSLSRLRILALHTCLELTTIFTPRIAQNLSCLAELTVEECPKVRSLISAPQSEHGPLFPSLERIILIDLPELDHIFGGLIVLKKLESLMIYNCVKLRRLSEMVLPRIQKIKGENKWWNSLNAYTPTWEKVFEPLKEKSELIKQLLEATNSLQHFHDVVSREAKYEKPLDGPGLGAQETKTDPCNFPLRKEKGRFHTLLEAKDKKPLDGPGLGAQETKTVPFNFPLRKEEGRFHTLLEAKDKKPLDGPGLGAQETKTDPFNFPLRKEEVRFHTLPEAKDKKPLDGPGLGAQETKTDPFNFPLRKEEVRFHTLPEAKDKKPLDGPGLGAQETKTVPFNFPLRKEEGRFHTLPGSTWSMEEAIAFDAGVAAAILQGKTTRDPIKRTIASSNDMDEIYGALDDAMKMLTAKKDDHDNMVQRRKTTMMPSNTYTNWNYRVNVVAKEVEKLKVMYLKESKRSSWFSFNTRSNFTKKMKKTATRVFALMEEDTQLVDFLVDKKPACVVEMITPTITNIPTLQKPLEQTLGWLCDKEVRGIRIHGLVGSGKTTIMQNLNNHVKVAEMFDIVIWVTVSREGSMENRAIDQIQQVIAQRLKLDIEVTTHHDLVASRIREELKDIKYVLLLDDVKEDLNLDKIGVPLSNNGSKIVFTTRLQHVCSSIATRQTNVAPLNRKEALLMFKSVLDRPHLEENSNIKRLMPQIINCCDHHPLMIKVAAGFFRVKETEESWHDGLMNLRKWPEKGGDTMQKIYRLLDSFFDCLTVTQKKCFFYTALYPEDSDIQKDCLLDNWAAEELLDAGDGVEVMRARGRDVLDYLKRVLLLEENTFQQCIRMHKLIRLAALYNFSTYDDQGILVKSGEALHKPLDVELWKEKKWISLVDSKMNALPDKPDCSTLSTLILQKNKNLEVIPRAFFKHMKSLRVLDLYDTRITSLPNSLLKLATLKVLYLQKCVALVELHHDIGNLQKLEVLDIRGSGLENIPPQVESLISLRRLLVSFTSSMGINPTQKAANEVEVISKIPMLKELVFDVEDGLERILYGAIVNVVRLTRLSLLQFCFSNKVVDYIKAIGGSRKIYFPNERLLQSYINRRDSVEFNKCQIFTGCDFSSHPHIMKFMPYFKFDGEVSDGTISQVLCNDAAIELVNHNGLEHLSSFTAENMNRIRSCVIKDCNKIRTIVDGNTGRGSILNKMEQLHMINLPVLKNICEGPMQGLKSLKTLMLSNCPKLTWVCTYGVILQLPEIRHLEVEGCIEITEIFNGSTNIVSPILPNLKKLILIDMPQLRSILVISNSFEWPSLERLKILGCPKLKRLPFQKDGAVKLTSIETEKSWWEALENDQEVTDQFRRYCTLK